MTAQNENCSTTEKNQTTVCAGCDMNGNHRL